MMTCSYGLSELVASVFALIRHSLIGLTGCCLEWYWLWYFCCGSDQCGSQCSLGVMALLFGGSGIRSDDGVSALVTDVIALALVWL
ncbi:hypothetical protein BKA91DRAFT_142726 [Yarrowia lipolytica]|nr:hypothetical protein BKA91DRAFT_142726 [Yarrowia lipolytica]KAE8168952.1 hypothetical protein BKA90DRAFT_143414 [Yarrowia lipolytica]RMI97850.1 hypothetical protein BD777DRAFT_126765 [Yarrowia lipolytica]